MADEQPTVEQTTDQLFPMKQKKNNQNKRLRLETKFSEEQVNEIVKQRLAKDRASMYNKLGVDDLDTAVNAVKLPKRQI